MYLSRAWLRNRRIAVRVMTSLALILILLSWHTTAKAESQGVQNAAQLDRYIVQALNAANQGDITSAKKSFDQFNKTWLSVEASVKSDSQQAYSDIESNMGQIQYAFMVGKRTEIITALEGLQRVDEKYVHAGYPSDSEFKPQQLTLSNFILLLQQTQSKVQAHVQPSALAAITRVRQSWLGVEGTIVAQSASAYNAAETDMVKTNAMIASGDYTGAQEVLGSMIRYLTPLSQTTTYSIWDAAMIPIREGFEALLVVAALLAFVKKSNAGKGKGWIWTGVLTGLGVSAILAIIVKFIFSSGTFGRNNFLISGWTGIIAAIMLLYMSYWLHSKSNVSDWNQYIRAKSKSALDTGRLVSLGVLTFLAVFREGTETVLFIIGMVNQISLRTMITGILIGLAVLAIIAYFLLIVGVKMPIRPFFAVSSLIVFYLCFKFTGLGIHSLQLGGILPATTSQNLPSIDFLGFFPSWQSAIPQFGLVLIALIIFVWSRVSTKRTLPATHNS